MGSLDHQHKVDNRILRAIATHEDGDSIVQQLKEGESHEAIVRRIQPISFSDSGSSERHIQDPSSPFEQGTISITDQDESEGQYVSEKPSQRNDTAPVSTKLEEERELYHAKAVPKFTGLSLSSIGSG